MKQHFKKLITKELSTIILCDTLFAGKITVEFSQPHYNVTESSGDLTVTLVLRKGVSDNDITVTVTPSDQSPLSAEGKRCVYPTMTS